MAFRKNRLVWMQGWEFALSLFRSWLFRSKLLILQSESRSCCSLKSNVSDSLMIRANRLQKRAIRDSYFSYVFDSVSPFLCPRVNRKSDFSDLLLLLFKKELATWAICLGCFVISKERPWAISSSRSFTHKKRAIRLKNRWANS